MKKLVLAVLMFVSTSAFAGKGGGAQEALGSVSMVTLSPFLLTFTTSGCGLGIGHCFEKKILENAKDDAAIFVGSEGKIRGVHLQTALEAVRKSSPAVQVSDIQIAQEILGLQ